MTTNPPKITLCAAYERTAILEASLRAAMESVIKLEKDLANSDAIIDDQATPQPPTGCIQSTTDTKIGILVCHWYPLNDIDDPVDVELVGVYANNQNLLAVLKDKFKARLKREFWQMRAREEILEYKDSLL